MKTTLLGTMFQAMAQEVMPGMLDRHYTMLKLGNKSTVKLEGEGAKRARERLAKHRRAQLKHDDKPSRQRHRRERMLLQKQMMTEAKRKALAKKVMGGPAQVRTLLDARAVLG